MNMQQFAGCHRFQNIKQPLLIWPKQEELPPEPFRGSLIFKRILVGEHIEQM